MSAKADSTMYESPRIASHCVLSQSYLVFAYRPLANAAVPFMLIRVSVSRAWTLRSASSPLVPALRLGFHSKRTCLLMQTAPCMKVDCSVPVALPQSPAFTIRADRPTCSYGSGCLMSMRPGVQAPLFACPLTTLS